MAYIPGRRKRVSLEENSLRKKYRIRPEDIDVIKLQKAYAEISEAYLQVKESHVEVILNLAIAAEFRDPDTGNHILRISDYATQVGSALGLPADQLEILRYASPMHDIGKIGIPDKILQKPGKLTADEWVIMKKHTLIGARMFQTSRSPLLRAAAEIAISHHEKYDGSGYPNGLRGDAIPLFGRIVALVDVFDAIVSKRCYKRAFSFDEGFVHLEKMAGHHLDPHLVKIFFQNREKILRIYEANQSIQRFIDEASTQAENWSLGED